MLVKYNAAFIIISLKINLFSPQALVARNYHPPFLTFCLHIYFQENFFISLLFHIFFLILTCSCQYSYNLMLTATYIFRSYIYILIIHKARNSETFDIVHLLASVTFNSPYSHYIIQTRTMYQFLKDVPFRLSACFVPTIAQLSRILRFSLIYCFIFRIVPFRRRK